ncbi:MAG: hydrogenase expression/formation protein HypE [Chitinivibrionales bacterium]|nr:hydrogenase expression/formation protein HypE [Chitinivibrionales bacterium]
MTIDRIKLSHGSGAGLAELLHEVILPALTRGDAGPLEDAAVLAPESDRLVFTTDSFVVDPIEFPGGDIGKLAACGTINDLAMMGAVPRYLSVALILEEGLECGLLTRVLGSLRAVCENAGVALSCGDTKVVERGKADRVFITTSGIGTVAADVTLSAANARNGDAVLVSGPIGRHGIAIMAQRTNLGFASSVVSDCAPLDRLARALLGAVPRTRVMRDATRGGGAAVLNELAEASGVTIRVRKMALPVTDTVASACAYLGMEPLQIANEGTFVAVVPRQDADAAVAALKAVPHGEGAAVIGTVEDQGRFPVLLETEVGGTRPVEVPPGRLLPRIC